MKFNGSRLRKAREAAGITQVTLAYLVGRSERMIRKYEQGLACPSADTVWLLAVSVGLDTRDLMRPSKARATKRKRKHS